MKYEVLRFKSEDRIARITLNRPDALNALNLQLLREIREVAEHLKDDPEVKLLIITGEGKAFCAGADLNMVNIAFGDWRQFSLVALEEFNQTILAVEQIPLPTIAMVNGFTFAGGIELCLACDFAIASEDAQIGDQHINYGIIGGPVYPQLTRRIGRQRALELTMTGRWLSGKEAQEIGLVYKAVPREKLEEETQKFASMFVDKNRDALINVKKAIKGSEHLSLVDAFEYALAQTRQHFSTSENARLGVKAFLEKEGPPKF